MKKILFSSAFAKWSITMALILVSSVAVLADGTISGRVVQRLTGEAVDFASVSLLDASTGRQLAIGTMTDSDGGFRLGHVKAGRYILRVSQVGNVAQERDVTVTDGADSSVGTVELSPDTKLLEEVVVTGRKSQMSVGTERRVFNVSSNVASVGASADELLAAIPSVDVSSSGDISLRGKEDVMVWVNGKEMGMNADNRARFLRQIPAEAVESIEVMTNPSAKHGTEGTAGIINIRLKDDSRHGYFGSADASVDSRGSVGADANVSYNEGKFEWFGGIGLKSKREPGGTSSRRYYDDGTSLISGGRIKSNENSGFLRIGTNFNPDDKNTFYLSAIGSIGHKWGSTLTTHKADMPDLWNTNHTNMRDRGDTRGANVMLGYKHTFSTEHTIDMNVSYNIWRGPDNNMTYERETWNDGIATSVWRSQRQDVHISNWEAALDYSRRLQPWLKLEAGYKGNYNHENSPASYGAGTSTDNIAPLNELYNRFKYDTDITALYLNFSGSAGGWNFAAGLRGEMWQTRTRSLSYGQTDADVDAFRRNSFALFPSASVGWSPTGSDELKLSYSRRIRRPFGPQLNTFENIADPSEVHLGNPLIEPEYSNSAELSWIHNYGSDMLSATAFVRSSSDMISHVSFLAPMASDPLTNTMYYGHANVGNMTDAGIELIARNTFLKCLTLTATINLYNSHLKGWTADYPLHDEFYTVSGRRQNRFVGDVRLMASVRLPWELTLQVTGRYSTSRITAQGTLEASRDAEAALQRRFGAWGVSMVCKDLFDTRKTVDIVYGNGYSQSIGKWTGGRTLRLTVSYSFGKSHEHSHDRHNHIDTGGYGEGGHQH